MHFYFGIYLFRIQVWLHMNYFYHLFFRSRYEPGKLPRRDVNFLEAVGSLVTRGNIAIMYTLIGVFIHIF